MYSPDIECFQCGTPYPVNQRFCPHCGARRGRSSKFAVAAWICFALIGIPAGAIGGCFGVLGALSLGSQPAQGDLGVVLLIAAVGILIAVGTLAWAISASRRRP